MSEATKRTASPAPEASGKKAKLSVFKEETDDEDSAAPPAVSSDKDGNKACKQETDGEADENPSIMTFSTVHDKFARLQLLPTHTLYDLVSTLCQHTAIGYDGSDGPDDHIWFITFQGKAYRSTDSECRSPLRANRTKLQELNLGEGSSLKLTYDYGSTSTYTIILAETEVLRNGDGMDSFPRNQPRSGIPASYKKYQPNANAGVNKKQLDIDFFYLNDWIFHKATSVSVNLFQPGRKKNFGFMDNKLTMMYLPAKPDCLANWLECFNRGASIKPEGVEEEGYAFNTWQSVVPLPRSKLTQQLTKKHKNNEKRGFCDAPIVEDHSYYSSNFGSNPSNSNSPKHLDKMFPKIAALAGLKKDKHVPKGWITFTKRGDQCSLAICKGNAREAPKSCAPKGLAFEGDKQHDPVEEPLFQVSGGIEIKGLQDLFCVVEGLLMTLP